MAKLILFYYAMNMTETMQTQSNTDLADRLAEALEGLPIEVLIYQGEVLLLIEEDGFHDAKKEGFPFHGRSCSDEIIDALTSAGFKAHRLPKPTAQSPKCKTGYIELDNGQRHEFLIVDAEDEAWDFYERGVVLPQTNDLPDEEFSRMTGIIEGCFSEI